MKIMVLITRIFLCIVLMASCTKVASMTPLSAPESAEHDRRLIGFWGAVEKIDDTTIAPGGWVHVSAAGYGMTEIYFYDDHNNLMMFRMHPTIDAPFNYMNLRPSFIDDSCLSEKCLKKVEEFGYLIMKYEVVGDALTIGVMGEHIRKAILAGELKGEIVIDDIMITDTAENILKYLQKADHERIFDEQIIFKKAKLVPLDFCTQNKDGEENEIEKVKPSS